MWLPLLTWLPLMWQFLIVLAAVTQCCIISSASSSRRSHSKTLRKQRRLDKGSKRQKVHRQSSQSGRSSNNIQSRQTDNKISVRATVQVRVKDSVARILFSEELSPTSSLRELADSVNNRINEQLSRVNNDTVRSSSRRELDKSNTFTVQPSLLIPGQLEKPILYADLSKYRLSNFIKCSKGELSVILDYTDEKRTKDKDNQQDCDTEKNNLYTLGRFLRMISMLKLADGITTTAKEALQLSILHFESLLPDGFGHNEDLADTMQLEGKSNSEIKHHFRRLFSIVDKSIVDSTLPDFIPKLIRVNDHGSEPYRCQQLCAGDIIRLLTTTCSDSMAVFSLQLETFAMQRLSQGFVPALLEMHWKRDKIAMRSLWRDYWANIKQRLREGEEFTIFEDPSSTLIKSVGDCIENTKGECLSGGDIEEIGKIVMYQLEKIERAKGGTEPDCECMNTFESGRKKIIDSCVYIMNTAEKDTMDLRTAIEPTHSKFSKLWEIARNGKLSEKERCEALDKIGSECLWKINEIFAVWSTEKIEDFCSALLMCLQVESSETVASGLAEVVARIGNHRSQSDKATETQQWRELHSYILISSLSDDVFAKHKIFHILSKEPTILGSDTALLVPLFAQSLATSDAKLRQLALESLTQIFESFTDESTTIMDHFIVLVPRLLQIASTWQGCFLRRLFCSCVMSKKEKMRLEERDEAWRCIENISKLPIMSLHSHLEDLVLLATQAIRRNDLCLSISTLTNIIANNWTKLTQAVSKTTMDELCSILLKRDPCMRRDYERSEHVQVILLIFARKYSAGEDWPELRQQLDKWSRTNNELLHMIIFSILRDAPVLFHTGSDAFKRNIGEILKKAWNITREDSYLRCEALFMVPYLLNSCDEKNNNEILSSLIPLLIQMSNNESAHKRDDNNAWCALMHAKRSLLITPHLTLLLELATVSLKGQKDQHDHYNISNFEHDIVELRSTMEDNANERGIWESVDKTAIIPSSIVPSDAFDIHDVASYSIDDQLEGKRIPMYSVVNEEE